MLPLLGGLVVFVVLGVMLLAERSFENARRLPRSRSRTPKPPIDAREVPRLHR